MLVRLLKESFHIQPQVWRDESTFQTFICDHEDVIAFIRIDDPSIPGLEWTKQAMTCYPKVQIVWMAANEEYALEAFPRGVDAYLLLPVTAEKVKEVMNCLAYKKQRYGLGKDLKNTPL